MENEKDLPISKEIKTGPGSDPENKFKKGSTGATAASVENIIKGAVENVKAHSGSGLASEGTNVDYNEEQ